MILIVTEFPLKSCPTVLSEPSTSELVIAAKRGDNEQLGLLLESYRGYLYMLAHRYLSQRLQRRIDPGDLVQITFLEAKRDWDQFRGNSPGECAAWLRNILKNNVATAVARHITSQKRSLTREIQASQVGNDDSQAQWLVSLPGSTTSPSRRAMKAEAAQQLFEALHTIPETQAEAIRLRYLEGLSLAEIVDRMGKSETAVAGLLKRGLQKLRDSIQLGQMGE